MTNPIFTPFKIGKLEIKNRIVMLPMGIHCPRLVHDDGSYTDVGEDYYIERAKGGVGLIVTGIVPVQSMFEHFPAGECADKAGQHYIDQMKKLADGCHQYGCKVVTQFTAGFGRVAAPFFEGEKVSAGNDMPNVWIPTIKHRALTIPEIQKYLEGFVHAAKAAQAAGIDGVEIHAVHEGYMLDQFTISCYNNRTDEYGGSLENRLRFPREIVQKIKEACGKDFPVMVRYSIESKVKAFNDGALPGEKYTELGRNMEESKVVAKLLQDFGYDALNCDNGSYDSWYWAHPPVYMPDACCLDDCKEIKKVVSIPVICGGKMGNPKYAQEALSKGEIDAFGLGRPLLADSEWPNKVKSNDIEDVRPCISCQVGCLGQLFKGGDCGCALNPQACHEKELELHPASKKKNIVVVGGGIAGMEAARVATLRGHTVTLLEKSDHLGGVFVPASSMSFKHNERRLIQWYIKQLKDLKVTVKLSTEATPESIKALNPEEVIVATGSTTRNLKGVNGCDCKNIVYAIDLLNKTKEINGENVVIIGAGLTGVEIAYDLLLVGKKVQLVEMKDQILDQPDLCVANSLMLKQILKYYKVPLHLKATLTKIEEKSVHWTVEGKEESAPADTVICCIGYDSNKALYDNLKAANLPVHIVGDSEHVSNLMGAIHSAYNLCLKL